MNKYFVYRGVEYPQIGDRIVVSSDFTKAKVIDRNITWVETLNHSGFMVRHEDLEPLSNEEFETMMLIDEPDWNTIIPDQRKSEQSARIG